MANAKNTTYKTIGNYLMQQLGTGTITVVETDAEGEEYDLEVPGLKWYDKQRGQVAHLTKELGIPFPAVLISFPDADFEQLGGGAQKGMTTVRITTLFENFADTFYGSPNQDVALKYFHFNDLIFETLNGFSGSCFSSLVRVRETEDEDHDFLIITTIDFATEITEQGRNRIERETGNPSVALGVAPTPEPTEPPEGQFVLPE